MARDHDLDVGKVDTPIEETITHWAFSFHRLEYAMDSIADDHNSEGEEDGNADDDGLEDEEEGSSNDKMD